MDTRFLRGDEILENIERQAKAASSWSVVTAQADAHEGTSAMWQQLEPHLTNLKIAIVGLELYQTEPWVLRELFQRGKLRLVNCTAGKFHAKLFVFESKSQLSAIVGSADLVDRQLSHGFECAVLVTCHRGSPFEDSVQAFMDNCLQRARMTTIAELDAYERAFRGKAALTVELRERYLRVSPERFMRASRTVLGSTGSVPKLNYLRQVASELGYAQMTHELRAILLEMMPVAVDRRVTHEQSGKVSLGTRTIADYPRQKLVQIVVEVLAGRGWQDREKVMQDVRKHLGFPRISRTIRAHVKSAINSAIRAKKVIRSSNNRIRTSD